MSLPQLLDLFCGAGGAARGYQMAGFHVTGVDIKPQPRYAGDTFIQADAMTFPLDGFDVVHASPPRQAFSPLNARVGYRHTLDLLTPTREHFATLGVPWVIENVPGAPMRHFIMLCGGMFGLRTYRHRRFESSHYIFQPHHPKHVIKTSTKKRRACWDAGMHVSITGDVGIYVGGQAMGIDWMTGDELSQAIPPAYTLYVGAQLMAALERGAA